ncbi:hypothetical protein, partial [Labilibaculum manganireducens]|uniref:RHS repeat domain-containing protein n=1 Tax=Labilibaculum manganireducens TaxID=1940525 RepID=UPI0029F48D4B
LTYDNNGNLTQTTRDGETTSYQWDCFDRLIKVTLPPQNGGSNGETVDFNYDEDGMLIKMDSEGTEQKFTQKGKFTTRELVKNSQGNWETTATHIIFGEMLSSYISPTSNKKANSSDVIFYHTDHIGSVRLITDSSGNIVSSSFTDSYGNPLPMENSSNGKSAKMLSEFNFAGANRVRYVKKVKLHNIRTAWNNNIDRRHISSNLSQVSASYKYQNLYLLIIPPIPDLDDFINPGWYPPPSPTPSKKAKSATLTIEAVKHEFPSLVDFPYIGSKEILLKKINQRDQFYKTLFRYSNVYWNTHGTEIDITHSNIGTKSTTWWYSNELNNRILEYGKDKTPRAQVVFALGCLLAGAAFHRLDSEKGSNKDEHINPSMAEGVLAGTGVNPFYQSSGFRENKRVFIGFQNSDANFHRNIIAKFANRISGSANNDWLESIEYAIFTYYRDITKKDFKHLKISKKNQLTRYSKKLKKANNMPILMWKNHRGCFYPIVVFGANKISFNTDADTIIPPSPPSPIS